MTNKYTLIPLGMCRRVVRQWITETTGCIIFVKGNREIQRNITFSEQPLSALWTLSMVNWNLEKCGHCKKQNQWILSLGKKEFKKKNERHLWNFKNRLERGKKYLEYWVIWHPFADKTKNRKIEQFTGTYIYGKRGVMGWSSRDGGEEGEMGF